MAADTLRSLIDAGRTGKRLDELSSARVIGKIAMQLHAAQQKAGSGKSVGPVSPAAITLDPDGDARLVLGESAGPGYASPEQAAGSSADRRSDVFSLGTVLWEALTHQRLFEAMNDAAVKVAVQEREIQPPSELNANVPAELSAICMRALSRNPADRFQSLKSMSVEIEEFLSEAGYEDNDDKIAAYLRAIGEAAKKPSIALPITTPLSQQPARTPSSSQPPPSDASAASAVASPATPSSAEPTLPSAVSTQTLIGHTSGPGGFEAVQPAQPNGSAPTRPDKSTISVSVPPQVKVETKSEAAVPTEAPKQPALLVDPPKQPATIVESTALPKVAETKQPATIVESTELPKVAETKQPATIVESTELPKVAEAKAKPDTLVDATPPAHVDTTPTLVDGKDARPTIVDPPKPVEVERREAPPVTSSAVTISPSASTQAPVATAVEAQAAQKPDDKAAESKAATSQSEGSKRAASQSEGSKRARSQNEGSKRASSRSDATPHPASVVSLPSPGRESKDVLAGWGWGTDKHDAIAPDQYDDDDYETPQANTKKILTYVIGGGLGLVVIVIIIMVGFGGSKSSKKTRPPQQAIQGELNPNGPSESGTSSTPSETGAAPAEGDATGGNSTAGTAVAETAPTTGTEPATATATATNTAATTAPATATTTAATTTTSPANTAATVAAANPTTAATNAPTTTTTEPAIARTATSSEPAAIAKTTSTGPTKTEPANARTKTEPAIARTKTESTTARTKVEPANARTKAEPKTIAKTNKANAKAEPKRTAKTEPRAKSTTKAEPKTVAKASKRDYQTAYRTGLQQFARGDTSGALASLRTALAGNPNYAPTWRGLGLVFEKMGERDQARAAFRRYLQLAPGAGDADNIRGRLERLGS